jgi:hypothetical protein
MSFNPPRFQPPDDGEIEQDPIFDADDVVEAARALARTTHSGEFSQLLIDIRRMVGCIRMDAYGMGLRDGRTS